MNFRRQLGFESRRWEAKEDFILASMKVDYLLQAEHPAVLEIGQRVNHIGKKYFDILTAIFIQDQPHPIVQATFTLVFYSHQEKKPIPVPEAVWQTYHKIQS